MSAPVYDILQDDLSGFDRQKPALVTFGEVMVRDTPADLERPERTRLVLCPWRAANTRYDRLHVGDPAAYVTRVPDNPGQPCEVLPANGVNTDHFLLPKTCR
jgi:hypothetical protein